MQVSFYKTYMNINIYYHYKIMLINSKIEWVKLKSMRQSFFCTYEAAYSLSGVQVKTGQSASLVSEYNKLFGINMTF